LEALRCRDQHVRRVVGLLAPLVSRGVAVAHRDLDAEPVAPPLQSVHHVAVERPERRDVERGDARARLVAGRVAGVDDGVEDGEHRRLRLPGARRGGDEGVLPVGQRRDRFALRLRRRREPCSESAVRSSLPRWAKASMPDSSAIT